MKNIFNLFSIIVLIGLLSCEPVNINTKSYLEIIPSDKYFSVDSVSNDFKNIYGKWKLYKVSGGFSGIGYEPDYDYLEIKKIGIYGLVRNDSLLKYGKIVPDTIDSRIIDKLQVRFIPDYYKDLNPYMAPQERFIELRHMDSLDLISQCCDLYDYHFKRIK